jgi:3-hydroxyisobutyrate dehydrogenase-like beta-hydroxyacid dehydrogenase
MGFGIAGSLIRAGLETYGFDVNPEPVRRLSEIGGLSGELAAVAPSIDILVVVVVNAAQLDQVLFGPGGAAAALRHGAVVVGCPTIAPEIARLTESRLAASGILYLDAPISGGAAKAEAGDLTVMMSGSTAAVEAATPALEAMAGKVFPLGNVAGPASAMKMINQLLAGVHIAAAAEAMTFGLNQGIPLATTLEVISQAAGTSWMFENRGPHIVAGDYTPRSAVDIFIKDLGIVAETARAARFAVPLAAAALQQFVAAGGSGLGREDDAAVAKVYARNAGLKLPGA